MLQTNLWTSLTWFSQSACFTKCFSHWGHLTLLCLLFTCMLHSAIFLKYPSQYLYFTWWSVYRVTGSSVTCSSVMTGSGVTVGCSRSMWSRSISSFARYCWHTLHLLCCESKCLSKSQGNMNSLIHILHHLNSALWYLVMWLCLYMLLLKKWLHASHSLSYSPVWTSKPFTSSTSTCGPYYMLAPWAPLSWAPSVVLAASAAGCPGCPSPWMAPAEGFRCVQVVAVLAPGRPDHPCPLKYPGNWFHARPVCGPPAYTLQKNVKSRCYNRKGDGHFGCVQQAYLCCH